MHCPWGVYTDKYGVLIATYNSFIEVYFLIVYISNYKTESFEVENRSRHILQEYFMHSLNVILQYNSKNKLYNKQEILKKTHFITENRVMLCKRNCFCTAKKNTKCPNEQQ